MGCSGLWRHFYPDACHELAELFPVFCNVDGIDIHSDDLNPKFFPDSLFPGFNAKV